METGAFSKHRHAIWKENKEKAFVACSRFIATSPPLRPLSLWLLPLPQPTISFLLPLSSPQDSFVSHTHAPTASED